MGNQAAEKRHQEEPYESPRGVIDKDRVGEVVECGTDPCGKPSAKSAEQQTCEQTEDVPNLKHCRACRGWYLDFQECSGYKNHCPHQPNYDNIIGGKF